MCQECTFFRCCAFVLPESSAADLLMPAVSCESEKEMLKSVFDSETRGCNRLSELPPSAIPVSDLAVSETLSSRHESSLSCTRALQRDANVYQTDSYIMNFTFDSIIAPFPFSFLNPLLSLHLCLHLSPPHPLPASLALWPRRPVSRQPAGVARR